MHTMVITRCQYMLGMTSGNASNPTNQDQSGQGQIGQLLPPHERVKTIGTDLDAPVQALFSLLFRIHAYTLSSSSFCCPKSPDGFRISVIMMAKSATTI